MQIFPNEFLDVMIQFKDVFSKRIYSHVQFLLVGAILCQGKRTISSVLRILGLSKVKNFGKYHRVLSRANWSSLRCSEILLHQLLKLLLPGDKLVFGIDETIEQRWGRKISKRGIYRDSVRSSKSHVVKCSGLRWLCVMLLVDVPWAARVWALPFLSTLAPSKGYAQKQGKIHKTVTQRAAQLISLIKHWLSDREIIVVGDNSYACMELLNRVCELATVIATMRMDAALYDFVSPRLPGQRGPNRKKGDKLPKLTEVLENPQTVWQMITITEWYGHTNKVMKVTTGTALWYRAGKPVIPLRWVLLCDPDQKLEPRAILCTDLSLSLKEIVTYYVRRWSVEVTFEEVRKHLGVGTQRQWSDKAIERTTPALMSLFSIVTLMAHRKALMGELPVVETSWYKKPYPTFSDALAYTRGLFWNKFNFLHSPKTGECKVTISKDLLEHMQQALIYAT